MARSVCIGPGKTGWSALTALCLTLVLGACAGSGLEQTAALVKQDDPPAPAKAATRGSDLEALAAANKADPKNVTTALAYARGLRATGAKAQALAVLDAAAADKTKDHRLQLERGLLALDLGQAAKAEVLLRQAVDPKAPDWRLRSALGAALASQGKQQEAQAQFAKALALAPDNPRVLNNLALSYALDGKAGEAVALLRKAQRAAPHDPQVQQNLALVLGLTGKYEEARTAAQAALPPAKASENVSYLKTLVGTRTADGSASANAGLSQPVYRLGGPAAGSSD
ncbi:MAG TPA: tetratricopeptide repeat protein [Hyphomicrobiaceae bacterium]|nr:tetratricopeptide repeat protein [Hyphomicrobiaceae bacterium]